MTRRSATYLASGVVAFASMFALGASVSHAAPSAFDVSELGQYGLATPVAELFTLIGRFPTYFALSIVALVFGFVRRAWLSRSVVAVAGLIVVWQTSDIVKLAFHRIRPPHPIVTETSFGYPSGHADLSLFFYGFWAHAIWKSELPSPARVAIVGALTLFILAIGWSRLALGAHYPTDVLGGYLFGAGWLAVALIVPTRIRQPKPGRQ